MSIYKTFINRRRIHTLNRNTPCVKFVLSDRRIRTAFNSYEELDTLIDTMSTNLYDKLVNIYKTIEEARRMNKNDKNFNQSTRNSLHRD